MLLKRLRSAGDSLIGSLFLMSIGLVPRLALTVVTPATTFGDFA